MPQVVLCSIGWGPHEELQDIARPSLRRFATRFGYDLDLRRRLLDERRPPAWSKIRLLRQHLDHYPIVLWIDADALVVDPRADLAATVSRKQPIAMVAHEYGGQRVPNSGVMALRRSRITARMLDSVWAKTEYLDHKWWENAALLDLLGYDISHEPIVKVRRSRFDQRVNWLGTEWNSIDASGCAQPIVRHYPGLGHSERVTRMCLEARMLAEG